MLNNLKYTVDLDIQEKTEEVTNVLLIDTTTPNYFFINPTKNRLCC